MLGAKDCCPTLGVNAGFLKVSTGSLMQPRPMAHGNNMTKNKGLHTLQTRCCSILIQRNQKMASVCQQLRFVCFFFIYILNVKINCEKVWKKGEERNFFAVIFGSRKFLWLFSERIFSRNFFGKNFWLKEFFHGNSWHQKLLTLKIFCRYSIFDSSNFFTGIFGCRIFLREFLALGIVLLEFLVPAIFLWKFLPPTIF